MKAEKVIQMMIDQGKISEAELEAMIQKEREKSPLVPINHDISSLKESSDVLLFGLADSFETQVVSDMNRQEENMVSIMAITEVYELLMLLQARLDNVEGGVNSG